MAENEKVIFRKIRGRIVPIRKKIEDNKVALGSGAVFAAAFENTRRATLSETDTRKVVERRSIFTPTTTVRVKDKTLGRPFLTTGTATFKKLPKKRGELLFLAGSDPKTNISLLTGVSRSAKKQNIRTLFGNLTSNEIVSVVSKRGGKLQSFSRSGQKLVGLKAARGEITRLRTGVPRTIIRGILRLR